ncbi:4-hydroxybenzoate polyprenyltransferase [Enhygromyxa salina]|uniref:Protoheme IX farnesyltransferase n=1 Tax=Enhygromyxa salina TaxID=215803 RepID=A0A0C2CZD7_9BACT|nr:heme o synthase [Enhygromyxa salina]KIG15015.1 4-hydroxybenzoate polyprenyltransferase [Enhygromyxa salina]
MTKPADPKTSPARDYLALTKPGIVRMCLIMTAGGLWLAPASSESGGWIVWVAALIGSALAVASANAFNMIAEREGDRSMARTRNRPLAAGRLSVARASVFAAALGVGSMLVLGFGTNVLTAGLAAFALLSYWLVYTPLKRKTPLALVIGAVPGAVPPVLGWTAVTGSLDLPGAVLFGILLVWQMPHFLAISIFRKQDYADAGIRVVPVVRGETVAKVQAILWAALLIPVSLALTPLGVTSEVYMVIAGAAGLVYLGFAIKGLTTHEHAAELRWARQLFGFSLIYLPVVTLALVIDLLWFSGGGL